MNDQKETNMNGNIWEMNNRGNHETTLRVREAEQAYQQWKLKRAQFSPKKPFSRQSTTWGTVFSLLFGSIQAKIRQLSVKKLNLSDDNWGKAQAG
jgi:hypothetical protein